MNGTWGYHLLLDCAQGNLEAIKDKETVLKFIHVLVDRIDMKAYGLPFIERFATHDAEKAGLSFCQMIETSNITGHFVDANGNFYIDIFSCKPYDVDSAVEVVNEFFSPKKIKHHFISRDA